jgi:peptidoglycan/LPS O-acetylase OafA/YrhL
MRWQPRQPNLHSYMPELDGLRAIAIAGVMAAHLYIPGFFLGGTGVNLFFVLSGFLITGILLDTKRRQGYFKNFYIRRSLRIFPIYYLMLAAVALWSWWSRSAVSDFPFYLIYLQNIRLGLFEFHPPFPYFFNHTWSLAVEEQFYVVWSLVVLRLRPRQLELVCVLAVPFALVCRFLVFSLTQNAVVTNLLLPAQLDALCLGALLAFTFRERSRLVSLLARAAPLITISTAAMIAAIVWHTGYEHYWVGDYYLFGRSNFAFFTIFAVLFAALLTTALCFDSDVSRALSWAPLRHIGKISYGLYLYHYPLFYGVDGLQHLESFAQLGIPEGGWNVLKVLLAYGVALGSWRYVESPLLALKERFAPSGLGADALAGSGRAVGPAIRAG